MKEDCLFCKIIRHEVPANILYEDDEYLVMLDAYPDTDGHALVIPKKHYEDIFEVPEEILSNIMHIGKNEGFKIIQKLTKSSLTFLINYGDDQVIKHLHLHLLPNFSKKENKLSKNEIYKILTKE